MEKRVFVEHFKCKTVSAEFFIGVVERLIIKAVFSSVVEVTRELFIVVI